MGKKILIVDDEADQIDYAAVLLEENGYITVSAMDGKEGMKKAKAEKPDLIFLDILMPERGGIGMYLDLKQNDETKNIPVVIVTAVARGGHFDETIITQGGTLPPPAGLLEKPMNPDAVLKLIRDLLS
jgi:CheY-like chemotaxis protein